MDLRAAQRFSRFGRPAAIPAAVAVAIVAAPAANATATVPAERPATAGTTACPGGSDGSVEPCPSAPTSFTAPTPVAPPAPQSSATAVDGVTWQATAGPTGEVTIRPTAPDPARDPATAGPSLTFAVAAARTFSVPLQLVHAWQVDRRSAVLGTSWGARRVRAARLRAQHRLDEVARMARELAGSAQGPTMSSRLVEATAAHALVQASEESCLVVTGTRGRAGWSGLLLGSRSRELAQEAACPVAIVRERD